MTISGGGSLRWLAAASCVSGNGGGSSVRGSIGIARHAHFVMGDAAGLPNRQAQPRRTGTARAFLSRFEGSLANFESSDRRRCGTERGRGEDMIGDGYVVA